MTELSKTIGPTQLSASGAERREAMLGELVGQMRHVHASRHSRRRNAAGAVLAGIMTIGALAALRFTAQPSTYSPATTTVAHYETVNPGTPPGESAPPNLPACVLVPVRTDASLLERCRVEPIAEIPVVSDDTLLRILDEIDRPSGLIRMGESVRLTRAVADPIGG